MENVQKNIGKDKSCISFLHAGTVPGPIAISGGAKTIKQKKIESKKGKTRKVQTNHSKTMTALNQVLACYRFSCNLFRPDYGNLAFECIAHTISPAVLCKLCKCIPLMRGQNKRGTKAILLHKRLTVLCETTVLCEIVF